MISAALTSAQRQAYYEAETTRSIASTPTSTNTRTITAHAKGALDSHELLRAFVRHKHVDFYDSTLFARTYEWMKARGLTEGGSDHATLVVRCHASPSMHTSRTCLLRLAARAHVGRSRRYLRTRDTILVPFGTTEQHGPAGPLGLDAYVAIALAEDAARKAGVLAALHCGTAIRATTSGSRAQSR